MARALDLARYADRNPLDFRRNERAALAGLLARGPQLLLHDEPHGGLDRETRKARCVLRSLATPCSRHARRFVVDEVATHVAVMERGDYGILRKENALKMRNVQGLFVLI
jgi:ABC-type sulfate/molybdate transport systems ATPase subunit